VGFPRASRIKPLSLRLLTLFLLAALLRNHFLHEGNKVAETFMTVAKGEGRI